MAKESGGRGRGGRRSGAGRHPIAESESAARPTASMRAWPDEWALLKRFKKAIVKNRAASETALEVLEIKIELIEKTKPKSGKRKGSKAE